MEYQLKPKPVAPAPNEQIIVINGREVGTISPSYHQKGIVIALVTVPHGIGQLTGGGYGDTPERAVENALQSLRNQAEAITKFLAEVDA